MPEVDRPSRSTAYSTVVADAVAQRRRATVEDNNDDMEYLADIPRLNWDPEGPLLIDVDELSSSPILDDASLLSSETFSSSF